MILSEFVSYEQLDEFLEMHDYNVSLHSNEDLGETFLNMASADMLVVSSSTFSIVAGMLSRGHVIVPTGDNLGSDKGFQFMFWEGEQKWTPVSFDIESKAHDQVTAMAEECLYYMQWHQVEDTYSIDRDYAQHNACRLFGEASAGCAHA